MKSYQPIRLHGNWVEGWALDFHTISSKFNYSFEKYITERTDVGELLYKLKYNNQWWRAWELSMIAADFLNKSKLSIIIDCIVAVPPSKRRLLYQPTNIVARRIGRIINKPVYRNVLKRRRRFSQMKFAENYNERIRITENSITVKKYKVKNKSVLLFDDLYRSGITLSESTKALYRQGESMSVYALVITKTRVRR